MAWKKYDKITRHGKNNTHLTLEGNPQISIQEKLDGANASFMIDDETNEVLCFSRNQQLDEKNTLRGFYNWVQEHIVPQKDKLLTGCIYVGEWLVLHKIQYDESNMNKFYLYDIYYQDIDTYFKSAVVRNEASILKVSVAPLFYEGDFQSIEHIQSFVGKSTLGEEGEGVVVKNYDYRDKGGNQVFTKFVSDSFAEKANVKKHDVTEKKDSLDEFIRMFLTQARIEKMLHKLVDEGLLDEGYAIEDMGTILKNMNTRIYEDIVEEELDTLLKQLRAKISKKVPPMIKDVLKEQGRA